MRPLNNFNLFSSVKALLTAGSRLAVVAVITLAGLTATARATPLTLLVTPMDWDCSGSQVTEAAATGGQPPYGFTWTNVSQVWSSSGDNPNYADLIVGQTAYITVQDANGQTKSKSIYIYPFCRYIIKDV